MRDRDEIEAAMNRHGDTVWHVCLGFFRSQHDAQDAFQEAFVKYSLADSTAFADEEHRKAWLITVASNVCRDMLRARHRGDLSLEEAEEAPGLASCDPNSQPGSFQSEVIDAFRALDDPPRLPLYLALCEGYSAPEIAKMMDAPVNTVYSWISRGKRSLKEALS